MAATYDFTPVNGGANTVGTLESVAQLKAFVIGIDADSDGTDDNPVDLRANDGAHGSMYDLILRELQPLMAHAPNDATGVISVTRLDMATLLLGLLFVRGRIAARLLQPGDGNLDLCYKCACPSCQST
jgi:hypothetical protein